MSVSSSRRKHRNEKEMKERAIATQAETLEWHKKRWGQRDINPLLPPLSCPAFAATAVMEDGHSEGMITKESFIEDYVLLLFMPMEGNVDKAELEAFSAELDHLAHLGCQVGKFDQHKNCYCPQRWWLSLGRVWLPFARFSSSKICSNLVSLFYLIDTPAFHSGPSLPRRASPSSVTRVSTSPRPLG